MSLDKMQSDMAIELFKKMKSDGFLPNAATYNVMVDCCSIIRCYKSACALVSMMVRDGFCPQAVTYTGLIKVFLSTGQVLLSLTYMPPAKMVILRI